MRLSSQSAYKAAIMGEETGGGDRLCDINANDTQEPLLPRENHPKTVTSSVIPRHCSGNTRIQFNVGGVVFHTLVGTVKKSKSKKFKLSDQAFLANYYDEQREEYFFDRDPEVFRSVLNYWRTGQLHVPVSMCGPQLKEELDFWGLREVDIQPCCWSSYHQSMQTLESLRQLERDRNPSYMRPSEVVNNSRRFCHLGRLRLWKLLTDPSDSKAAKIYAYVSLVFVLLAIFSFCASTHHLFDVSTSANNSGWSRNSHVDINTSSTDQQTTEMVQTTPHRLHEAHWRDSFFSKIHPVLLYIDVICLVFFTVEYLVKLFCASPRCQFVKSITAVFDLLAILPDYVELVLFFFFPQLLVSKKTAIIDFMPFLRLMRAFRIFRLIRRVPGLWIMMYTLRASFKELSLMLVFLLVGTLLFASIIFFLDDPKVFTSIPHGFWWAIVTMTTVGYGDMAPVTAWGQIVGSVTAICGVLIVGFTIPSLVNNFITYYNHIEFVVQKERLLKILETEELLGLGYNYSDTAVNEQSDKRNGSLLELKENTATVDSVSVVAQNCVDEEKGGVGEQFDIEGDKEEDESYQPVPVSSQGISLISFRSLSKQRINFAD